MKSEARPALVMIKVTLKIEKGARIMTMTVLYGVGGTRE